MSRSWIKRLFGPSAQVGIAIGRGLVCASVVGPEDANRPIRAIEVRELAEPLFAGRPSPAAETVLADALRSVSEAFSNEFASVCVALPDSVIRSTVFDLDELPKNEELRGALLRWRFAKEWQRPEDSLDCRGQDAGEDGGKKMLFGQAADLAWLDCVRRTLMQAGIAPWSLNAASVYRFNCFHDELAGSSGALLSLDPDCWNLQLWDAAGRVRRVLTRLRETGVQESEVAQIADEAERAILAHVRGGGAARAVDRLYLAGSEKDMELLASAFKGRLREEAVPLRAFEKISGVAAGMKEGLAPLALAAALSI